jgi:hypothetical protein
MFPRLVLLVCLVPPLARAEPGDLWKGLSPGPYGVGFQFSHTVDPTRNIDSKHPGTPFGLALWYPSSQPGPKATFVTQLEYRLLEFSRPLAPAARQAYADQQAQQMVAWRHIGIVPLTVEQARATLNATGRAVRGAPRVKGRFPVVIILGGPWYLATTAEFLASHGYLVLACVRFRDSRTEIPSSDFRWSIENSLRDAEWALTEFRQDPAADMKSVTSLGHGGGGLQALLLGMRNRQVTAVANIDAAIFSSRTNPAQFLFYNPSLLRVPYLNLLTADTRQHSDQYADFEKMRFSGRYEVILTNPDLRHHDLSSVGRGVSASLGIRGDPQPIVLQTYADVQTTILQFLEANQHPQTNAFAEWLQHLGQSPAYACTTREATQPAPELYDVLTEIDRWTPDRLREAYERDPDADAFSEDGLLLIMNVARTRDTHLAQSFVPLAIEIRPNSVQLLQLASAIEESSGESPNAQDLALRCLAISVQDGDWRSQAAQTQCRGIVAKSSD